MGLLSQSTEKKGLLARTPVVNPSDVIKKTEAKPSGLLSGSATISQGKVSLKDKLLSKLPNTFAGDIIRGVADAPRKIAEELGLFQEDVTTRLDRVAKPLIEKGVDPTRAYDIASTKTGRANLTPDIYGLKAISEQEEALNITPEEEQATKGGQLKNLAMQALTVSGVLPGAGTIQKKVGQGLLKSGEKRFGKQSIEELEKKGLISKGVPESIRGIPTNKVIETAQGEGQTAISARKILDNEGIDYKVPTRTPEETALMRAKTQARREAPIPSSVSQKKVPLLEKVPKKEVPVIAQSEEMVSKLPSQYRRDVASLPSIIDQHITDVKGKINVLDYFRTPDRVLNKIGLGKEANLIRKGYEGYVKELPKNIDKITEWSKLVPKKSNERIFKYLDGQEVTLNDQEAKVASQIRTWLKEWAERLKLPQDNRISNYITHIFDKEIAGKEFDEDLAKIITDKIPGEIYDPFLLKRLGMKGYKQDTWAALDAYVKRATRKANMDDALEALQAKVGSSLEMSKLETSQFKYIQRYINNVNMRPTELDSVIDNSLKSIFGYKYGTRPVTYLTRLLRQMTYRGMLGLNVGSALRNLSQGINTYAKLGEKHTVLGYANLFKPGAKAELEEVGVLADNFIQDRSLSSTKKALEKIDKGLWAMFSTAEHINRGAAYFGAKSKGLAKGMSEEEAVEYAKKMVRDTQFAFGSIDTPVAFQSDIAKTLVQFQTFTTKQIEFLTEMAKDKNFVGLLRYAVAGLVFVHTIGKAVNMEAKQLLPMYRFDIPPSLKAPVEITKVALDAPDKYGQPRTLEEKASDVGKSFVGLIPGGTQIKKTVEGANLVKEEGSFDKGGNLQFEAPETTKGKAQALLFGKFSTEKANKYFDRAKEAEADIKKIQPIYDEVQQLIKDGKQDEAQVIVDNLGDKGYEVYKKIKAKDVAEKTKEGKKAFLPTYRKIRKLADEGKTEEATAILDNLTDDEYKYYKAFKKQLNP